MISVMEMERAVIAAAIREQNANTIEVIERLSDACFENDFLSAVWRTIVKLQRSNEPIDVVTVGSFHEDDFLAIRRIVEDTPISPIQIKAYAKKVRQAHNLRNAVQIMQGAIDTITQCNDTSRIGEAAKSVEDALSEMVIETDSKMPRSGKEILPDYMDYINARFEGHESARMIKLGIESLDELLGGLNPVDLVAVGGCSGMGKTELLIKLTNGVMLAGMSVLNFTMEMDEFQIVERSISDLAGIGVGSLRNPRGMDGDEWAKVSKSVGELNNERYWIHDEQSISIEKVCSVSRMMKNKQPDLGLIIVDYAQIMEMPKANSQTEAIAIITGRLKGLAKELRTPVILLSQLNEKQIKERRDKRPMNGDFFGSAAITNDADRIFFVYRDEVYHSDSTMKGFAEIIVSKNRFGQTGTIYQRWVNGHYVDVDQAEVAMQIQHNQEIKQNNSKKGGGLI